MGWLSRLFGGDGDSTGEAVTKANTEAPSPAPVTPMAVLIGTDSNAPSRIKASGALDVADEDTDGVTLIPGDGSDIGDAIEAMRKAAREEMLNKR